MDNWDFEIKEQNRFLPLANGTYLCHLPQPTPC